MPQCEHSKPNTDKHIRRVQLDGMRNQNRQCAHHIQNATRFVQLDNNRQVRRQHLNIITTRNLCKPTYAGRWLLVYSNS